MWPFKKSRPAEKEKAFLITEEADVGQFDDC